MRPEVILGESFAGTHELARGVDLIVDLLLPLHDVLPRRAARADGVVHVVDQPAQVRHRRFHFGAGLLRARARTLRVHDLRVDVALEARPGIHVHGRIDEAIQTAAPRARCIVRRADARRVAAATRRRVVRFPERACLVPRPRKDVLPDREDHDQEDQPFDDARQIHARDCSACYACTPGASAPVLSTYSLYEPPYTRGVSPISRTRVDRPRRNVRSCETKSIVPSKAFNASTSISFVARSRWFVGSSSTRKFCGSRSIRASTSRDFSPPDSGRIFFSTSSPENWNAPRRLRSTPMPSSGKSFWICSQTVSSGSRRSRDCCAK